MEQTIILFVLAAVALIWLTARPKSHRTQRRMGTPRLWDRAPMADGAAWVAGGASNSNATEDRSENSHHGGFRSSTNSPSYNGGGSDGGEGDGGGD